MIQKQIHRISIASWSLPRAWVSN